MAGHDEWGTIETALDDMASELARSTEAMQRSNERLDLALSGANDGLWDWNLEDDSVYYSPRWKSMLGYTEDELADRLDTFFALLDPQQKDRVCAEISDYLAERADSFQTEFRMRHKSGDWVDILSRGQLARDDQGNPLRPRRVIGTHVDITERNRDAQELRRHRDHLEELVRERTHDLVLAKEAAEAASYAKSAFLANMSHELRTPIHGILGMTELARRRASDPKQLAQLGRVAEAARHLGQVISDILDISKIEADRLQLEPVDFQLGALVERVMAMIEGVAVEKDLNLSVDLPGSLADVTLRGDELRLSQVLLNLAANAVKFTSEGSVSIGVRAADEDVRGLRVHFAIGDTGIGIAPED